jgi:hypothetical protein
METRKALALYKMDQEKDFSIENQLHLRVRLLKFLPRLLRTKKSTFTRLMSLKVV